ncbi:unnamed protein product, partial [marine sediment metagenome]
EDLETKRLLIRQLTREDFNLLDRNINGDTGNSGFQLIRFFEKSDTLLFSLLLRESNQTLGFVALQILEKEEQMECYYELLPQYTGNGYAIEAMKKIFGYVFGNLQFDKIVAHVDQGNSRGWKVAERSGMKYTGDIIRKGASTKSMYFSINKSDFFNQFQY